MEDNTHPHGKKDNRQNPRIKGAIVEYSHCDKEDSFQTGLMRDVSVRGVGISVPEAMEVGTVLFLKVFLTGSTDYFKTKGKVVWQKRSGYMKYYDLGIQFVDMNEKDQERLLYYILNFDEDRAPKVPEDGHKGEDLVYETPMHVDIIHVPKEEDGFKKFYYDTGELLCEYEIVRGKIHGSKRTYYRSGQLLEEVDWKNGKRHGMRNTYYKNGALNIEQEFLDGKRISFKKYDPRGNIVLEKNYGQD